MATSALDYLTERTVCEIFAENFLETQSFLLLIGLQLFVQQILLCLWKMDFFRKLVLTSNF